MLSLLYIVTFLIHGISSLRIVAPSAATPGQTIQVHWRRDFLEPFITLTFRARGTAGVGESVVMNSRGLPSGVVNVRIPEQATGTWVIEASNPLNPLVPITRSNSIQVLAVHNTPSSPVTPNPVPAPVPVPPNTPEPTPSPTPRPQPDANAPSNDSPSTRPNEEENKSGGEIGNGGTRAPENENLNSTNGGASEERTTSNSDVGTTVVTAGGPNETLGSDGGVVRGTTGTVVGSQGIGTPSYGSGSASGPQGALPTESSNDALEPADTSPNNGSSSNIGMIIGILLGIMVIVGLVCFLIIRNRRRRRRVRTSEFYQHKLGLPALEVPYTTGTVTPFTYDRGSPNLPLPSPTFNSDEKDLVKAPSPLPPQGLPHMQHEGLSSQIIDFDPYGGIERYSAQFPMPPSFSPPTAPTSPVKEEIAMLRDVSNSMGGESFAY